MGLNFEMKKISEKEAAELISCSKELKELEKILKEMGKIAVAFSGGVDSTFLLCFAQTVLEHENVLALTALAPNFAPDEISFAKDYTDFLGIKHLTIPVEMNKHVEGSDCSSKSSYTMESLFTENPPDRCYHCKRMVFSSLLGSPELSGFTLCDGTNTDDSTDYRPGMKALKELKIRSPLAEAGLSKVQIRAASKALNVPIWNKPAFACLASRIPYGEPITAEKLSSIYILESALRDAGFAQCRIRHHGDVARIEVLPEDRQRFISDDNLCNLIQETAIKAGFKFAALDILGYRMGSLNETLAIK